MRRGAASLLQCTHAHTQTRRDNKQENIWAVKTSPHTHTHIFLSCRVFAGPCAKKDAFRTRTVLCTVIEEDFLFCFVLLVCFLESRPRHSLSLSEGPESIAILPGLCTASVDTAPCCSGVICDEVLIVYTGCCQLRCLKYLTIIIYY